MDIQEKTAKFVSSAPPLRDADLEQINGLFRAYLFRIARTGEYWTTCCRKHVEPHKELSPQERTIMICEHTQQERYSWGNVTNRMQSEARWKCPLCGAEVTVKELGRTGRRENLESFRRAIVLRWWRGALWAVGYDAKKAYPAYDGPLSGTHRLTRLPDVKPVGVYRFRPGLAQGTIRPWWYDQTCQFYNMQEQKSPSRKGKPSELDSPFSWCKEYGREYDVIGYSELDKSPFRYIGVQGLTEGPPYVDLIRLLTTACFYAEKLEMLHKFGMEEAIGRYVSQGVKTAWLINWQAETRKEFIKLPIRAVREAKDGEGGIEALRIWKTMGPKEPMEGCCWLAAKVYDYKRREKLRGIAKANGIHLDKIADYLQKQFSEQKRNQDMDSFITFWTDYLDAAEGLGMDLTNPVILMPRDLRGHHDELTTTWAEVKKAEALRIEREKYAPRYKKLCKRYEFSEDGLRIIVPESTEQIIQEGRNLKHCVGGYASRHVAGSTTILFLRRENAPHTSLITIEINGTTVRQAHGWRNEAEGCEDNPNGTPPQKLYAAFFDCWRDWLKRGSPRDKDGKPKIGKKYEKGKDRKRAGDTNRKAG